MSERHEHIKQPTIAEIRQIVGEKPNTIVEVYIQLHQLVLDTLPDVSWSIDTVDGGIGYGAHQYGYDGWGIAALTPYARWASLTLTRGSELEDPADILTGSARVRHIKLSTPAQVDACRVAIIGVLREASTLFA